MNDAERARLIDVVFGKMRASPKKTLVELLREAELTLLAKPDRRFVRPDDTPYQPFHRAAFVLIGDGEATPFVDHQRLVATP